MKGSKLKQTVIKQSYLLPLLLMVVLLAGCKTSKVVKTTPVEPAYLSSKLQLTVPNKNGSMTVSGSMKMKSGERIQLSVLMPVFRSEVMRMEVTPDEVLLIDRMNKRYVRATRDELKGILPETFGRKDKHQLLLNRLILIQILYGRFILLLLILQIPLESPELPL